MPPERAQNAPAVAVDTLPLAIEIPTQHRHSLVRPTKTLCQGFVTGKITNVLVAFRYKSSSSIPSRLGFGQGLGTGPALVSRGCGARSGRGEEQPGRDVRRWAGRPKDYAQAAHWYRAAADLGDATGQYDLANLYSVGRGVPLDYITAYMLYTVASSSGDDRSSHELKSLSKRMTPRQIEQAQTQLANYQLANDKTQHLPADDTQAAGLMPLPESK